MNKPSVSVVIPAYNCESTIVDGIKAVLEQSFKPLDIVVVDDGSTDKTASIVKNISDIRYFYQENQGPAAARNRGVKESKGEIVFFTDSDCVPQKNWIETAIKHFSESNVAVVAGSYGILNTNSLLARCIHAEIVFRHHKLMPQRPKSFGSYNFGVKKDVFNAVNGFNEGYKRASGEDNDLSYKIIKAGHVIYFEKDALVGHFHPTNVWKYLKEQFQHGFWRVQMYSEHPEMAKGDDYTFWKDIVEIPLSYLIIFLFIISYFFAISLEVFAVLSLAILVLLQLYYNYVTLKKVFETIFYSFVTFVRSFARSLGFLVGIAAKILPKKS